MVRPYRHIAILAAGASMSSPSAALAWGDKGHEIIALIAEKYLEPAVRARVNAMLAVDTTNDLTPHDIANEATWADKINKEIRNKGSHEACPTCEWHFINIEITKPDLDEACYGHPALPPGTPASRGPSHDCIVDKLEQFERELADPVTVADERLLALKFVLHFVGDLHQPLHVADDHDAGGNLKRVVLPPAAHMNLHFYWDVPLVDRLGMDPMRVAEGLIARMSDEQRAAWSAGSVVDWTWGTFRVGRSHAYGLLPPPDSTGAYVLTQTYLKASLQDAASELSKAGVRLAVSLNRALR
jgi:hypothetical protein